MGISHSPAFQRRRKTASAAIVHSLDDDEHAVFDPQGEQRDDFGAVGLVGWIEVQDFRRQPCGPSRF
jgi:hypothetical protein